LIKNEQNVESRRAPLSPLFVPLCCNKQEHIIKKLMLQCKEISCVLSARVFPAIQHQITLM